MDKAWAWVKEHPYISAIVVFVVGLVIVLMFFRGSGAVDNSGQAAAAIQAARASEAASGNQLAGMQLAGQAATNQVNAENATAQVKIAADERIAKIAADASTANTTIAAQSAKDVATITGTTSLGISTINARLESKKTTLGVLDSLYQTLVKQNPAWVFNSNRGDQYTRTDSSGGGGGDTLTQSGMTYSNSSLSGSYGQGVSGNIGDTPFAINITPLLSAWTPWGATQPLAQAPNINHTIDDSQLLIGQAGN